MVNVFLHVLVIVLEIFFLAKKPFALLIDDLKFVVAGCCKN